MIALLAVLLVQAPDRVPASATADTLQHRSGLYVGFGIGPAYVGYSCDGCPQRGGGLAGLAQLRIGTAVSSHLTVGLEFDSWKRAENDDDALSTMVAVNYYPVAARGAFLRAGGGLVSFHGDEIIDGPTETGSGTAVMVGIGYDGRFDRKLSFTPMLTMMYQDIGRAGYGAFSTTRERTEAWAVGFGVGLTWH